MGTKEPKSYPGGKRDRLRGRLARTRTCGEVAGNVQESWEPASMNAVWSAYRSLRQYLHSVHQNEDPELVLPGGDMDSDSEDEDDGKGL